jgi:hypothetical protein
MGPFKIDRRSNEEPNWRQIQGILIAISGLVGVVKFYFLSLLVSIDYSTVLSRWIIVAIHVDFEENYARGKQKISISKVPLHRKRFATESDFGSITLNSGSQGFHFFSLKPIKIFKLERTFHAKLPHGAKILELRAFSVMYTSLCRNLQ